MDINRQNNIPLAYRLRPQHLEEFVGQEAIVGKGRLLYRLIKADRLVSAIFYGPPGCGKTTLAEIIAQETEQPFQRLNAITSGVKDIRTLAEEVQNSILYPKRSCLLFLDEVHHLNKTQQDVLLPYVEKGTFVFIGATTENPFFTINSALLSRSTVFKFSPLLPEETARIISDTIARVNLGDDLAVDMTEDAFQFLVTAAGGDARVAINAIELAILTADQGENGKVLLDLETIEDSIQQKMVRYDRKGDDHYDVISAFIKSMRGSDPDAALHYLARMLAAGEDINFIARRILIAAAEDVGLANPAALTVAAAAADAVRMIGMPEARIILAEAVLMVATSPKSNAGYVAIDDALDDIRNKDIGEVPNHLKDQSYSGARKMGHGKGYKYPHDYPGAYVDQQYLPEALRESLYYQPKSIGYEEKVRERLERIRQNKSDLNKN